MDVTIARDTVNDTPGEEAMTRLQDQGLLPKTATVHSIERRAINAQAAGPVFAHLDPRQAYQPGKAALEVIRSSWFNNEAMPPFVRVGNNGDVLYPLLGMLFSGLGASTEAVVTVDLRIFDSNDVVQLTATGNPITMTVSHGAMGVSAAPFWCL